MQLKNKNNKINRVVDTSLNNLKNIIDVDTVIGKPIKVESNQIIIPVSKVTFGILSGGGEYGKINFFKKGDDLPYTAGNGSIVNIKPICFLVKNSLDEEFKILSISDKSEEKLFDKAIDFLSSFNNLEGK